MIAKTKSGIEIRKSKAVIVRTKNTIMVKKNAIARKKDTGKAAYRGAKQSWRNAPSI
jgi:hypothetical protein